MDVEPNAHLPLDPASNHGRRRRSVSSEDDQIDLFLPSHHRSSSV
jgi:hypothetical protein